MTTPAEKVAAAEKAESEKQAAVTGAQAVAEAVTKVANDAVEKARAVQVGQGLDFVISGTPGGRFTIRGTGFTGGGTVLLAGKQLFTDEWGGELIRGKLPADAKSGEVVVWIDDKTRQTGYLKV